MNGASFVPQAVPRLVAELQARSEELKPYLSGMSAFISALNTSTDTSRIDIITLHKIAYKKSNRRAALVKKNDPKTVLKITELAFSLTDDVKPLQLLCVLDGVNIPTASSVLSWLFPERWPVIDQRAWRTLYKAGIVTSRPSGTSLGIPQWRVYLEAVRALQAEIGNLARTPQQVDRLLYGLDELERGQA
ncbi:hypothetical protein [Sulfitobacter pontiacus]|uniref:hypothetical protein n=1 Tax=Sulfitobacter pontiacus TaxID=60137 RepID=UPI0030EEE83F